MDDKYKNKYRVPSARLQNWNYGWDASYFVTICTYNRECLFGEITDGKMRLSDIGGMANKYWLEIPDHFPFVDLDVFVVMPNHIHGIIVIDRPYDDTSTVETRHALSLQPTPDGTTDPIITIGQRRFQNQGKHTLSSIIGSYKSVVTKNARVIHTDFAWQSRFHDHIIRDKDSYKAISHYIRNNPENWDNDKFNSIM